MASIDFTATHPETGEIYTRSSGTMPYVAVSIGSQVQWHKTFASAYKAATSRTQTYRTGVPATVVPVTMVKFNGKVTPEWEATMSDGWGDITGLAMAEVITAKRLTVAQTPEEHVAEVVAEAKPAKEETPAQARARQRAAKKAREAAAAVPTGANILAGAVEAVSPKPVNRVEELHPDEPELGVPSLPVIEHHAGFQTEADLSVQPKLKKGQVRNADGTVTWKNSGEAHNAYRRARRAALKAQADRDALKAKGLG